MQLLINHPNICYRMMYKAVAALMLRILFELAILGDPTGSCALPVLAQADSDRDLIALWVARSASVRLVA